MFEHIKPGDTVKRMLAGTIPMTMTVTKVENDMIYATVNGVPDAWTFDVKTGVEIDEGLQWGPKYGATGSFLVPN